MGILATILGSGDVVSKGLGLIDDMWETDAEKRESKTKAKIDLMKAYAPFKIAQRYLALMFGGTYLACFVVVLISTLAGVGDPKAVVDIMTEFKIGWIMVSIIVFYFGGGLVESGGRAKKK